MKAQKIFMVLFCIAILGGCGNKSKETGDSTPILQNQMDLSGTANDKVAPTSTERNSKVDEFKTIQTNFDSEIPVLKDRMIIRIGSMNIEIENYSESDKKVTEAVARANGYVSNTTTTVNVSGKKQGTIQVKIPADKFDGFVQDVSNIGKVMSENISGKDVTEEYIDLEARQKTQRELEKRLLDLLNEKTAKLVDVVEVEEKLSSVRENIERTEGRMRFLKNQSAYSTLSISLFEPALLQTSSGGGFFYEMKTAISKGLEGFTDVLSGLIAFMIAFSPVLIFIFVILFIIRRYIRNRKAKNGNLQVQS